jgi:histone-lysine N-methyltransferase MLL1
VSLYLPDEMYNILSYLPDHIEFMCRKCSLERPTVWEIAIREEMQAGFNIILHSLLTSKAAHHMSRFDPKKVCRLEYSTTFQYCLVLQIP